jgi:RNA polymerase II subunit A-like phosphatase
MGTATDESGSEDSDASSTSTSRLQRRKKRTLERVTSLTNVVTADKSSGLPSPETTGPEEDNSLPYEELGEDMEDKIVKPEGHDIAEEDHDYDDGLEAEMLAEFEKNDDDE